MEPNGMTNKPLMRKRSFLWRELNYKPCAVLVGQTGAGKTTLSNKLCLTEHEAGSGRGSVTQNLFRNDVCHGFYPFYLIDTPGTDSKIDTLKHAILLREALSASPINTVFQVINYDTRFDRMVQVFMNQPTELFRKKIVVMISHMDQSENPEDEFREICETFDDYDPEIANFIFFSKSSPPGLIAILMYECMSFMTSEKLQISDEEFYLKFNLFQGFKGEMNRYLKNHQNEVKRILKEYNDLAAAVHRNETEDKDHVLHMAIIWFRKDLDSLLDNFREKHGGKMQEMENYSFYIKMQRQNLEYNDEFVKTIVPLMSYNLFDNTDPRNLIKACPHCNIIWFKTEGCDGETTCGKHNFSGTSVSDAFDYVFERVNGAIQYFKKPTKRGSNVTLRKTPLAASSSHYRGCGNRIVWKDLPKLKEEVILELYKVKTIDEVRKIISEADHIEARKEYERNIDKEFKE